MAALKFGVYFFILVIAQIFWSDSEHQAGDNLSEWSNKQLTRKKRDIICGSDSFEKLLNCCDIPFLLPLTAYQNCSSNRSLIRSGSRRTNSIRSRFNGLFTDTGEVTRGQGQEGGLIQQTGRRVLKVLQQRTKLLGLNVTVNGGNVYKFNTKDTPCLLECVFKNQSLLSTGGNIDLVSLSLKLIEAGVDAPWQNVLQNAISTCTPRLAGISGTISTLITTLRMCNPGPALLMACIHRNFALNCPTALTTRRSQDCPEISLAARYCSQNDTLLRNLTSGGSQVATSSLPVATTRTSVGNQTQSSNTTAKPSTTVVGRGTNTTASAG